MKIFLDTALIDEIKEGFQTGLVDGVTTNPSLMEKAVSNLKDTTVEKYINQILDITKDAPVSLEIKGGNADEMIAQGKALYKRFKTENNNVVIKVPISAREDTTPNFDAIKTIKALTDENIPVNVTLIFTPEQAYLAAKAGATYVSPFVGRVDDMLRKKAGIEFDKNDYFPAEGLEDDEGDLEVYGIVSGIDLVQQIVNIFDTYGYPTQVLAASLRNTEQITECALAGADVVTLPLKVLEQMTAHKQTAEGMKSFLKATPKEYEKLME